MNEKNETLIKEYEQKRDEAKSLQWEFDKSQIAEVICTRGRSGGTINDKSAEILTAEITRLTTIIETERSKLAALSADELNDEYARMCEARDRQAPPHGAFMEYQRYQWMVARLEAEIARRTPEPTKTSPTDLMNMNGEELATAAGLDLTECTEKTYVHIVDGEVKAVELSPREYVNSEDYGAFVVAELGDHMTPSEAAHWRGVSTQAVYDILRDEDRRAVIFPTAQKIGEGKRGQWLLDPREVLAWKPRDYPRS
jgi:hypothetical protein